MDIKKFKFLCPYCNTSVSKNGIISLATLRENGDRGMIHMSTTFGNYSYDHVPEYEFVNGEVVEFICPNCHKNLDSEEYLHFAQLKMKVDQNIEFDVIFSRKAGLRKTYVITEDGIESYDG
ncbi:hypothetical protein [Crocinitomix catalasitica]|uniref:hypothetical protein n=1 Tax=Crocinitomix catalasitica TaxID=184607 RepID=UPI0004894DF6|nr:hypothetical protein [Crocinitomix catalasitica]